MTETITRAHQANACAIRQLMGWPPYQPSNDCIAFGCGAPLDPLLALKVAQMAEEMRKDWVYAQYLKSAAWMPARIGIVYRRLADVEVIDNCHLGGGRGRAAHRRLAAHGRALRHRQAELAPADRGTAERLG